MSIANQTNFSIPPLLNLEIFKSESQNLRSSASNCPDGFFDLSRGETSDLAHGSCFRLIPPMNFDQAAKLCSCLESNLPTFSRQEAFPLEKLALTSPLKGPGLYEKIWLGYTDREKEGVWIDAWGNELELDNWGEWDGELLPDNAVWYDKNRNEYFQNCMLVNIRGQPGKMDDDFCIRERYSFCQTRKCDRNEICVRNEQCPVPGRPNWFEEQRENELLFNMDNLEDSKFESKCQPPFEDYNDDECFIVIPHAPYKASKTICSDLQGHFPRINSVGDSKRIGRLAPESKFTESEETIWVDTKKKNGRWVSDANEFASPVNFLNWAPGVPDNRQLQGVGQNCIVLNAGGLGLWDDEWCTAPHMAICIRPKAVKMSQDEEEMGNKMNETNGVINIGDSIDDTLIGLNNMEEEFENEIIDDSKAPTISPETETLENAEIGTRSGAFPLFSSFLISLLCILLE